MNWIFRLDKGTLHNAINRTDFVSWWMLYTYEGNKMRIREKTTLYFRGWTIKSHSPRSEIYQCVENAT